jgi:hypothetical protein
MAVFATDLPYVRAVPTCSLREDIAGVKTRHSGDWDICAVIDEARIVLGLLDSEVDPTGTPDYRRSDETRTAHHEAECFDR